MNPRYCGTKYWHPPVYCAPLIPITAHPTHNFSTAACDMVSQFNLLNRFSVHKYRKMWHKSGAGAGCVKHGEMWGNTPAISQPRHQPSVDSCQGDVLNFYRCSSHHKTDLSTMKRNLIFDETEFGIIRITLVSDDQNALKYWRKRCLETNKIESSFKPWHVAFAWGWIIMLLRTNPNVNFMKIRGLQLVEPTRVRRVANCRTLCTLGKSSFEGYFKVSICLRDDRSP